MAAVTVRAADPCKILLTFDDGPQSANTSKVAKALDDRGISGVFFVQTHALMCGKDEDCAGNKVILEKVHPKHLVAIHTGSKEDHVEHWRRVALAAENVTGDAKPDGENALESDMIRAKERLLSLLGTVPAYVRAPRGEKTNPKPKPGDVSTTAKVNAAYASQKLKHIGWDKDSQDSKPGATAETVTANLGKASAPEFGGAGPVIILFHDRNGITATNIGKYIDAIKQSCKDQNREATFVASKADAEAVLKAWKQ